MNRPLTAEEKLKRKETKEKNRIEREKANFLSTYNTALADKSLPEFRIVNNVLYIKRFTDEELNRIKTIWLNDINNQIKKYTFEDLCSDRMGYFEVNARDYNPAEIIRFYFYNYHVDFYELKIEYKIVDNLFNLI